MIVTTVTVTVVPEFVEAFIAATILNHEGSRKEAGNLRFDVLRRSGEPNVFTLYEAWADEAATAAHKETSHYKTWRQTVEPWMSQARVGVPHTVVRPLDSESW